MKKGGLFFEAGEQWAMSNKNVAFERGGFYQIPTVLTKYIRKL